MTEGFIPLNAGDLPIETAVLDDDGVYAVELQKVTVSPKTDKNGNPYCAIQCVVTEGDFEGVTIQRNYLPLPVAVHQDAGKRERVQAQNRSAQFGRFARSFKLTGVVPYVSDPRNDEEVSAFRDYMDTFIGNAGKVTVENSEYQGRTRSAIADFIF